MSAAKTISKVLFEAPHCTAASWQVVNDGVMGGLSTSSLHMEGMAAIFQGELSRRNNGGFASVRLTMSATDLTSYDAFRLLLRGDGRRYQFTVRTVSTRDSLSYQCGLEARAAERETHLVPFHRLIASFRGRAVPDAVPLDPSDIISLGFLISDQQEGPFRLEIAQIESCILQRQ